MNTVLVEPEIPNNTGNIGRTCVGLWSHLHLVGPLGFVIEDKQLKRAGLDYWPHLEVSKYSSWQKFHPQLPIRERIFFFETGAPRSIFDAEFEIGDYLVFGRETKGFRPEILEEYEDRVFSLPFPGKVRSFNLANAVAMAMGEVHRQLIHRHPEVRQNSHPC